MGVKQGFERGAYRQVGFVCDLTGLPHAQGNPAVLMVALTNPVVRYGIRLGSLTGKCVNSHIAWNP